MDRSQSASQHSRCCMARGIEYRGLRTTAREPLPMPGILSFLACASEVMVSGQSCSACDDFLNARDLNTSPARQASIPCNA